MSAALTGPMVPRLQAEAPELQHVPTLRARSTARMHACMRQACDKGSQHGADSDVDSRIITTNAAHQDRRNKHKMDGFIDRVVMVSPVKGQLRGQVQIEPE